MQRKPAYQDNFSFNDSYNFEISKILNLFTVYTHTRYMRRHQFFSRAYTDVYTYRYREKENQISGFSSSKSTGGLNRREPHRCPRVFEGSRPGCEKKGINFTFIPSPILLPTSSTRLLRASPIDSLRRPFRHFRRAKGPKPSRNSLVVRPTTAWLRCCRRHRVR